MLFNTISFWTLFIVFLAVFALLRRWSRTGMMVYVIAFSLFFFYSANGWLMLLLPFSGIISWWMTKVMKESDGYGRILLVGNIIALDLTPLLFFKYSNFTLQTFSTLMQANLPIMDMALPIGISFYTFQAISYTIDVYRRKYETDVSLLDYLFYITFFPLLLAGPITRIGDLHPQLQRKGDVSQRLMYSGLWLIIIGLFKKNIIADYIAQYNNWIFDAPTGYSGFENLMGMFGYTLQIYCDFSGYSDMSIGIAAMMGIRLRDNFNFPYQSTNLQEFWHRWHISLSTWFRDYLYIPLGGNRQGNLRTYFNNFITMTVAGLWHGSTWMFVLWGALHGLGLIISKAAKPLTTHLPDTMPIRLLCWTLTMAWVAIAWVFFRAEDITTGWQIISRSFTEIDIAYIPVFCKARSLWTALFLAGFIMQAIPQRYYNRLHMRFICMPWIVKLLIFTITIQLCIEMHSNDIQPFLYYQF